jgi:YHS domain-containing protein
MAVTAASRHHYEHEGRAYFFCSEMSRSLMSAPTNSTTPAPSWPSTAGSGVG